MVRYLVSPEGTRHAATATAQGRMWRDATHVIQRYTGCTHSDKHRGSSQREGRVCTDPRCFMWTATVSMSRSEEITKRCCTAPRHWAQNSIWEKQTTRFTRPNTADTLTNQMHDCSVAFVRWKGIFQFWPWEPAAPLTCRNETLNI